MSNTAQLDSEWNEAKTRLETLASATGCEVTKNKCNSAVETAQVLRDCGRMTDGINTMWQAWDSIK